MPSYLECQLIKTLISIDLTFTVERIYMSKYEETLLTDPALRLLFAVILFFVFFVSGFAMGITWNLVTFFQ